MRVQEKGQNTTVWFVRIVVICSMLSVWKAEIGGMALLSVVLFAVGFGVYLKKMVDYLYPIAYAE